MITAKCIQKFRDKNNRICGYRLQDQQGYTKDVNSEQLKAAIAQKQIVITNLTLTIDGRLVDSKERKVQAIDNKAIYDSICNTLRFKKCKVLRDDGPSNLCIITKPDIDGCYIKISSPYNSVDDAIINGEVIYGLGDGPISTRRWTNIGCGNMPIDA